MEDKVTNYHNDFQFKMEQHLMEFKELKQFIPGTNLKRRWEYYDIADNLFPPVKHSFLQYIYDNAIVLHDYINHVRSSQAFAINLIYPIWLKEKEILLNILAKKSKVNLHEIIKIAFEYAPETDLLEEWKSNIRPDKYVTSTDIAIFCRDTEGKKYIFLIEVKFTEAGFTPCGGYKSRGNRSTDICEDGQQLFEDKNKCYLQMRTRGKSARRYFNYFIDLRSAFPGISKQSACPFQKNHQCVRNHAFARALVEGGECEEAYFVLLYHNKNQQIEDEWIKYSKLVSPDIEKGLFSIKASELLNESANRILKEYFKARYLLE
jgi:hypothetical protein